MSIQNTVIIFSASLWSTTTDDVIVRFADPYVKLYLLYNGQRISKKKTNVKKKTQHPVYNQSFLFDVPQNEGLQNVALEVQVYSWVEDPVLILSFKFYAEVSISVWQVLNWDRMTKNELIGRVELGARLTGTEGKHWNEVMNCPRKQIAEWHKLKS